MYINQHGGGIMQVNQSQLAANTYTLDIKGDIKLSSDSPSSQTDATQNNDILSQVKNGKISGKDISNSYLFEYTLQIQSTTSSNMQAQSGLDGLGKNLDKIKELLKSINGGDIGYTGKPLDQLTPDEAKQLTSNDGFFGVDKTAQRISDFVINGSGGDLEKLKAGRDGMIKGFDDAQQVWGDKLPDISQQTIKKATEAVDKKIAELGGTVIDTQA
jgi:hypothetical protein